LKIKVNGTGQVKFKTVIGAGAVFPLTSRWYCIALKTNNNGLIKTTFLKKKPLL
jgi:hypothetical protein